MTGGAGTGREGEPPFGEVLQEAVRGIRSEILLYGIVVIVIIVGSAQFGIAILERLEIPLLAFATFVLVVYFLLSWSRAKERATKRPGKGGAP